MKSVSLPTIFMGKILFVLLYYARDMNVWEFNLWAVVAVRGGESWGQTFCKISLPFNHFIIIIMYRFADYSENILCFNFIHRIYK